MNKFSERLKELRKEKNISQSELAKVVNVGQRCVSGWEAGTRQPEYDILIALAMYFGVSTDYLLGLEN